MSIQCFRRLARHVRVKVHGGPYTTVQAVVGESRCKYNCTGTKNHPIVPLRGGTNGCIGRTKVSNEVTILDGADCKVLSAAFHGVDKMWD